MNLDLREAEMEDDDPESFVLMKLIEQINKRQGKRSSYNVPEKRSGNSLKKMYNVEMLRRLSGGRLKKTLFFSRN